MKKIFTVMMSMLLVSVLLAGCSSSKDNEVVGDKEYLKKVGNYSFWENKSENSVAQYNIYNHVNDFLSDGTIVNGDVLSADGKTKKVLFLGFDGMRADALTNIISDKNEFDSSGYNYDAQFSGINQLRKSGGVYLAYCGGETGTETEQTTSTSASWTSQFTGEWGTKHGVKTNDDFKNLEYKTFMLQYAEKGLKTCIAFDWDQYLDVNLKEEVKYVMANPQIEMAFCDIDREKSDKLKKTNAETIELYNFVAPNSPSKYTPYDVGMKDYVIEQINNGTDIVSGIFHNIDSNGHTYGFSNASSNYVSSARNCDNYAYEIVKLIEERQAQNNEEWLIVFANDHGGINLGHGEQSLEERTTWIATNKKINEKYFSDSYDGHNVKS